MATKITPEALAQALFELAEEEGAPMPRLLDPAELEGNWETWLRTLFGRYVSDANGAPIPFGAHHGDFWDWVWRVRLGYYQAPFVGVWARGGAKSTSAELAVVALAARRSRRYGLYVCHQEGTEVFTPELGRWHPVQEHPSASFREGPGRRVGLFGLPDPEVVTHDHRYWARTVRLLHPGHGRPDEHLVSEPAWAHAADLTTDHWIGYPVQEGAESPPEGFSWTHPDWWWLFGLWWGDGTLGGPKGGQITLYLGATEHGLIERTRAFLRGQGFPVNEYEHGGCLRLSFWSPELAAWLAAWKQGPRARKCPPAWVEALPLHLQMRLVRGYLDADGHTDRRSVRITSIHLPGLLALRRILMRLGLAGSIKRLRRGGASVIQGRAVTQQDCYVLQFTRGADIFGYDLPDYRDKYAHPVCYVEGGWLWSRVRSLEEVPWARFVPIQTTGHVYLSAFGLSHNCETQDRADDHVSNVGGMLENDLFAEAYPTVAARMVSKYGHSKGWRRNRLRTASGFTLDAIGLDTASRGAKLDEARPDFMVFDDIDDKLDTPLTTSKKEQVISHSLLPAGSADCITLAIQNMILPDGVFARLCRKGASGADFLLDRIVSGPHPALHGFAYRTETDPDGRMRYIIEAGRPTWEGQNLSRCQAMLERMGLKAFLNECQHEVEAPPGGMYDDIAFVHCRPEEVPDLITVEGWVDPAVTESDDSDCHGIQVDGLARNGKIYRLFSWEQRASPDRAIEQALLATCAHRGQRVGVETNQGGDLWRDKYFQVAGRLRSEGRIDYIPAFASEKAGSGDGPKVHRQSLQLAAYEAGGFVHVLDKDEGYVTLERALRRFPKTAPLDLADASYWSWRSLEAKRSRLGILAVGGNTRPSTWRFGGGDDDGDD